MPILIHAIVAFVLWLLLTWSLDAQNLYVGMVVAVVAAYLATRLLPRRKVNLNLLSLLKRTCWFLYYLPVFLCYCLKANFDVAYRVLQVNLPIRPGIVKVTTTLTSELGKTFLANSITLTPGTLTVDIDGQDLYIHWIYVASDDPKEQNEIIINKFERILKKVFDPC